MLRTLPVSVYILIICALVTINIILYGALCMPREAEVHVFSVGKGSAVLVRSRTGKTVLIDTGPDASILRALGGVLPYWQRAIDAVILTSQKAAFSGGLPLLKSRFHIPIPVSIGDQAAPYGTSFLFDNDITLTLIAPGTFSVTYGVSTLLISTSTQQKTYVL